MERLGKCAIITFKNAIYQFIILINLFYFYLQKNRNSILGKLCYSVEASSLAALKGGEQMKVSAGGGGKVLLLTANAVKEFFNTHVVNHFQNQKQLDAGAGEGMLQGAGGSEIEDREEELAEDEGEDMELENRNHAIDEYGAVDPVFNSTTGCLAWAMYDVVDASDDEAASDRELAQQNDDIMDGLAASQSQDDDSDMESPESEQLDGLDGGDE